MYDVRFGNLARLRRGNFAKQERAGCHGTVRGRNYKGTGADGVCLCTIYDVRCTIWKFGEPPARGDAKCKRRWRVEHDGWLVRKGWIMRSQVHGLVKSIYDLGSEEAVAREGK